MSAWYVKRSFHNERVRASKKVDVIKQNSLCKAVPLCWCDPPDMTLELTLELTLALTLEVEVEVKLKLKVHLKPTLTPTPTP